MGDSREDILSEGIAVAADTGLEGKVGFGKLDFFGNQKRAA